MLSLCNLSVNAAICVFFCFVFFIQIDTLFQWQSNPHNDVKNTINKQKPNTKMEFEERAQQVIVQFAEQVRSTLATVIPKISVSSGWQKILNIQTRHHSRQTGPPFTTFSKIKLNTVCMYPLFMSTYFSKGSAYILYSINSCSLSPVLKKNFAVYSQYNVHVTFYYRA